MAIKKDCSRFSDRNKIRRMTQEGFSVQQIADTVSITESHVQYVQKHWDSAKESIKDMTLENQRAKMLKAKENELPEHGSVLTERERDEIAQAARKATIEELIKLGLLKDGQAEVKDEAPVKEETPIKEPKPAPIVKDSKPVPTRTRTRKKVNNNKKAAT